MSDFDKMRAEMFKKMDDYCKEKNITRDELVNQIDKCDKAQSKRKGNVRVTKVK
jgi:hypothetical protein